MAYTNTLELISVGSVSEVKTGKKPYKVIELAFKNEGKVEGKKVIDFQNPDLFAKVQTLKVGDVITVVKEKDANGYWQWTSLEIGMGTSTSGNPTETSRSVADTSGSGRPVGRVTGSNYETPEERAIRRAFEVTKQRVITKQWAVNAALTFAELSKLAKPSVQGIIGIAQEFEAYAGSTDPVKDIVDMPDDIPV